MINNFEKKRNRSEKKYVHWKEIDQTRICTKLKNMDTKD